MYSEAEVATMNRTARSAGAVGADPIVPRLVRTSYAAPGDMVLDYGAGPSRRHAERLAATTPNVMIHTHDIGANVHPGHVQEIQPERYDIAYASNVLNVQPSPAGIRDVLRDLHRALKPGGMAMFNHPPSPRHNGATVRDVLDIAGDIFGRSDVKLHPRYPTVVIATRV